MRPHKHLIIVLAIFATHALAQVNYAFKHLSPLQDQSVREGEISFSWERTLGDKTPLELQIKNKSGNMIYTRTSIGSRRTKWLTEGKYSWRITIPGSDEGEWISFDVSAQGQKQIQTPPSETTKTEQTIDRIEQTKHDLLEKKNELVISNEKQQIEVENLTDKINEKLQNSRTQESRFKSEIIAQKNIQEKILIDEKMLFLAGPKPELQNGGDAILTALKHLRLQSKYPKSLEPVGWSLAYPYEEKGTHFWAWRLRVAGIASFGHALEEDVVVLWRLGKWQGFRLP